MLRSVLVSLLISLGLVGGFKTGLEEGLICNVCVGTHPGTVQVHMYFTLGFVDLLSSTKTSKTPYRFIFVKKIIWGSQRLKIK
jgi:hypothetical protein